MQYKMKRILLILLVSLGAVFAKAQTPFTTPNLLTGGNTKITQNKGAGQFDSGFILVQIFADTIAANGSAISLKAGAMIRVGDEGAWPKTALVFGRKYGAKTRAI